MSDRDLDESLRARLHALARAEAEAEPRLADDAEQRVLRAIVQAEVPARSRVGAVVAVAVTAGLAAAAAFSLMWSGPSPAGPPARAGEGPEAAAAVTDPPKKATCALVDAWSRARFESRADGTRSLTVAHHARVLSQPDTRVSLRAGAPCRAELVLEHGRVVVEASALEGGELWVRTEHGDVIVRGTLFAVEDDTDALTVDLAEGSVLVSDGHEPLARLHAGTRLRLAAGTRTETGLAGDAVARLRAELGPLSAGTPAPTAATTPESTTPKAREATTARRDRPRVDSSERASPSAESLLSRAETELSAGDVERARNSYRRAGRMAGPAAEAAWLRLARLELRRKRPEAVAQALSEHARRFARGQLAAEAAWLRVQLAQLRGEPGALRAAAEALLREHPRSPQAQAARRLLAPSHGGNP